MGKIETLLTTSLETYLALGRFGGVFLQEALDLGDDVLRGGIRGQLAQESDKGRVETVPGRAAVGGEAADEASEAVGEGGRRV